MWFGIICFFSKCVLKTEWCVEVLILMLVKSTYIGQSYVPPKGSDSLWRTSNMQYWKWVGVGKQCFSHVARTVRSDLCGVLCACFLRLPWSQPRSRGTCPVSCGLLRSHFPSELFFVKGKVTLGLFFFQKALLPRFGSAMQNSSLSSQYCRMPSWSSYFVSAAWLRCFMEIM